jgi:hypothetical protein
MRKVSPTASERMSGMHTPESSEAVQDPVTTYFMSRVMSRVIARGLAAPLGNRQ